MIEIEYTETHTIEFNNTAEMFCFARDRADHEAVGAVRVWLSLKTIGEHKPKYILTESRVGYSAEAKVGGLWYCATGETAPEALAELMGLVVS